MVFIKVANSWIKFRRRTLRITKLTRLPIFLSLKIRRHPSLYQGLIFFSFFSKNRFVPDFVNQLQPDQSFLEPHNKPIDVSGLQKVQ